MLGRYEGERTLVIVAGMLGRYEGERNLAIAAGLFGYRAGEKIGLFIEIIFFSKVTVFFRWESDKLSH